MRVLRKIYSMFRDFIEYNLQSSRKMHTPDLMKPNEMERNSAEGEVFILFTGASLKGKDLSWLDSRDVIATNLAFMNELYDHFRVKHYAILEPWSYKNYFFMGHILDMALSRRKQSTRPKVWLSATAKHYIDSQSLHNDFNTSELLSGVDIRYIRNKGNFESEGLVKSDFTEPCNVAQGTTTFVLFLAMYLGYSKIYLLGSDYQKTPMLLGHFYDNIRQEVSFSDVNDIAGFDVVAQNDARIEKIKSYAFTKGVEIINVVDDGFESRCLPSVKYDEIVKNFVCSKTA